MDKFKRVKKKKEQPTQHSSKESGKRRQKNDEALAYSVHQSMHLFPSPIPNETASNLSSQFVNIDLSTKKVS